MNKVELKDIYDKTDQGLDILKDWVPGLADAVSSNIKAKFRFLRPNEKTPSACLVMPSAEYPYYGIVDFGDDPRKVHSPIDAFMMAKGMSQQDFSLAVAMLANIYNVISTLDSSINKADWKDPRDARDNEHEGDIVFEVREGDFTQVELDVWGKNIKAEHLHELGWKPVKWCGIVKGGKVRECHATPNFPIFVQTCPYNDKDGNSHSFYKIYKPYEPNSGFRFMSSGKKPNDYIFGLDALIRAYHRNGDEKLEKVALVSGGSDAANALMMGLQPVWLNSETTELTQDQYCTILLYAKTLYYIPDVDETGIRMGKKTALDFPEIQTIWLPQDLMVSFHDKRGKACKDLKDYVRLRPSKQSFHRLVDSAKKARFWWYSSDKDGKKHPESSLTGLSYCLWLNDYYVLHDDHAKDARFIHIDSIIVEEVKIKDIIHFLQEWMPEHGAYQNVMDKVLRSKDLTSHLAPTMNEVELNFQSGTPTSQWFYFQNCGLEVTKDGIIRHTYREMPKGVRYVWKNKIIPHNYVEHKPMFNIRKNDDGTYSIEILSKDSEIFCFLINASRNYWRKEMEEPFINNPDGKDEYARSHKFCIDGEGLTEDEIREQMQSLVNKIFCYGYLLHRYKVMSRAWAVVLNDSRIGNTSDECNGRSGKSIYLKWLRTLLKVVTIEAKNRYITDRQFVFASVSDDTDIVGVDECHKDLDYHYFYGPVTDDFPIEKKGIDPYSIPFVKSPKILIATNYVIKDTDSSTEARTLDCVFSDYYHQQSKSNDYLESRSVRDDFGHNLFDDQYTCWEADLAFMMQCEQWYLSVIEGDEKVLPPMANIERRRQKAMLGKTFESWASDYFQADGPHLDCSLKFDDVYTDYYKEVGQKFAVAQDLFNRKLHEYSDYAEHISVFNPRDITGMDKDGLRWRIHESNGYVRYIYIRSVAAVTQSKPTEPEEPGLWEDDDVEPF